MKKEILAILEKGVRGSDNAMLRGLVKYIEVMNERSPWFITYHSRPKKAADYGTFSDFDGSLEDFAVVMQGPVFPLGDFTFETLRLYRRHAPRARIYLATWRDTPADQLREAEACGAEVVLCDKPEVPGLYNVNMQITSAGAGVRRAVDAGARWVLKTRTDQRLCRPNAFATLVTLALQYPVATEHDQKHRIVGVGQGSLKYAPHHVTDQTVFGHAEDMLRYWTPPLRSGALPAHWPKPAEVFNGVPVGELCEHGAAESYLASQFLERIGRPVRWTLEDTWQAYRDHFCFADYGMTDLYWGKSQTWTKREHNFEYPAISNREEMGFADWLMLHSGAIPAEHARRFEHSLASCFPSPVSRVEDASAASPSLSR